jgi:hypothetical protein
VSDLLAKAFAALGPAPSDDELELVARSLDETGQASLIEEACADDVAWKRLTRLAEASGSSGFVALDLATVVTSGADALVHKGLQ